LTDSKDYTGKTPLHFAVLSTTENQIDIIRLLIENGSKVNEKDDEGRTPLHYASDAGKSRCIPILLKNKANITLKDNLKKTPL
jgi:ankyrin repeat protein